MAQDNADFRRALSDVLGRDEVRRLHEAVTAALASGQRVILDASAVAHVEMIGWAWLAHLRRQARLLDQPVEITNPSPALIQAAKACGCLPLLDGSELD
jgi:anti-anti-sigma regulatory factor